MMQIETVTDALELETYLSAVAEAATRHLRRAKTPQWRRDTLTMTVQAVRYARVAVCGGDGQRAWAELNRAQGLLHMTREQYLA
jgi:hypothetical protein